MQDIYDLFDSNNTGKKYEVLHIADYTLSYIENKGFLCTGDTLHGLMYFLQLIYKGGRKAHSFRCGMDSPYIMY